MSSIRDKIIEAAKEEATPSPYGKVSDVARDGQGKRAGWRVLKSYFDEAVFGWAEQNWQARGKIKVGSEWKDITYLDGVQIPNYRVPQPIYNAGSSLGKLTNLLTGQQYKESGVSWCGIFATWVLRKAGLGVWWKPGIVGSQVEKVSGNKGMQPGDVVVFQGVQVHHAIFIAENQKAQGGDGSIETINGNSNFQSIERHSRYFPNQIWYYYRILD